MAACALRCGEVFRGWGLEVVPQTWRYRDRPCATAGYAPVATPRSFPSEPIPQRLVALPQLIALLLVATLSLAEPSDLLVCGRRAGHGAEHRRRPVRLTGGDAGEVPPIAERLEVSSEALVD